MGRVFSSLLWTPPFSYPLQQCRLFFMLCLFVLLSLSLFFIFTFVSPLASRAMVEAGTACCPGSEGLTYTAPEVFSNGGLSLALFTPVAHEPPSPLSPR